MLRGLKDNFETKGYYVLTAIDGKQGLDTALKEKPDLILLDIMLPEINGYEVCSHVREQGLDMPIIMLTAKDQESDIVLGLNLGADDYVTKPFSIKELMARAEAFMRRRKEPEPPVYEFGDCRMDVPGRSLHRAGKDVELTPGIDDFGFSGVENFLICSVARRESSALVGGTSRPPIGLKSATRVTPRFTGVFSDAAAWATPGTPRTASASLA